MRIKIIAYISILSVIALIVVLGFQQTNSNEKKSFKDSSKIYYVDADETLTFNNIEEMIGYSDFVFVGTVDEVIGSYYDEEKDLMPYTKYKMTIKNNYKGNLQEKIIISKNGGYDEDGTLHLFKTDAGVEDMLELNESYLILANAQSNGELLVISVGGTYHLLDNIDSYSKNNIGVEQYKGNKKIDLNLEKSIANEKEYSRQRYTTKYEKAN